MEKKIPLVSVVISCFNERRYIQECIESVFAQSYPNVECVVVDDASTDGTQDIIRALLRDQDISVFKEENVGHEICFNEAIRLARGKYVKVICADDYLLPESISVSVQVLEENPKVALATHGSLLVDERSRKIMDLLYVRATTTLDRRRAIMKTFISGTNTIGHPGTTLFRKEDYDRGIIWDFSIIGAGELDLWLKLLEFGDLYYIPKSYCAFRVSPKSATLIHSTKIAKHFLRFVKRVLLDNPEIPKYVLPMAITAAYVKQVLRIAVFLFVGARSSILGTLRS